VTAHTESYDSGVLWMNAAETWVEIDKWYEEDYNGKESRLVNFLSESGLLEFFMIASVGSPLSSISTYKSQRVNPSHRVQKKVSEITGYQVLPPYFSVGFHYCKWEKKTSADRMLEWNEKFESNKIPVDVFWMDLPHTENTKYFTFDEHKFSQEKAKLMRELVEQAGRRLVVITDPHIKQDHGYFVFNEGLGMNKHHNSQGFVNIFVEDRNGEVMYGHCWPGTSTWIDYINEQGREYWGSLYSYERFKGTSDIFHIWLDMNEPSVFDGTENTLPKDSRHYMNDQTMVFHKDVHNLYGRMMVEGTYHGMLNRQPDLQRPLILTRSVFFGSQKYSAKWTGDNKSTFQELKVSIPMLLSLGISGV